MAFQSYISLHNKISPPWVVGSTTIQLKMINQRIFILVIYLDFWGKKLKKEIGSSDMIATPDAD